jgi:hypothetical protein
MTFLGPPLLLQLTAPPQCVINPKFNLLPILMHASHPSLFGSEHFSSLRRRYSSQLRLSMSLIRNLTFFQFLCMLGIALPLAQNISHPSTAATAHGSASVCH